MSDYLKALRVAEKLRTFDLIFSGHNIHGGLEGVFSFILSTPHGEVELRVDVREPNTVQVTTNRYKNKISVFKYDGMD